MSFIDGEKTIPHSEEAEKAVLTSMLRSASAISEAVQVLKQEDFYFPEHGILFEAMVRLNDQGTPVDLITLVASLEKDDMLEKAGGRGRVAGLFDAPVTPYHVRHYADIVREKSVLRRLIAAGTHIVNESYEDEKSVEQILDDAERHILDISQDRDQRDLTKVYHIIDSTLDRLDALSNNTSDVTGVPSGFIDLDRMTAGWQASDLVILAARPAMGKTAFALNIANHAAVMKNIPTAVFSLEMSKEQLVQRMMSTNAQIDQHALRTGKLYGDQWDHLMKANGPLASAPLYIDDTPSISVRELRAKSRRLQAKEKDLGLIIIDYLQLMTGGSAESRQQEVSMISRSLKGLARELSVPVIALSQLSRKVEETADKRPQLSHLRESGSIEQDADLVMFIYREDYYFPDTERAGTSDIIIAKHRNGPTGSVELVFTKEFTRFDNLYREPN